MNTDQQETLAQTHSDLSVKRQEVSNFKDRLRRKSDLANFVPKKDYTNFVRTLPKQNQEDCTESFFHKYTLVNNIIGEGAQAIVKKCICTKTGKEYAVKITRDVNEEIINMTQESFELHKTLKHKNIVKAVELFIDEQKESIYYVMEFFQQPTLQDLIRKERQNEQNSRTIIHQIVKTMKYMHSQGVCHRDLKPENILVNPNDLEDIKIIDFGVAKQFKKNEKFRNKVKRFNMLTSTGTFNYKSPEMLQGIFYTEAVDMFSLGVITFQILSGTLPFYSKFMSTQIKNTINCQYTFNKEWENISEDAKSFIRQLLVKDSIRRLTTGECLAHTWLKNNQQKDQNQMYTEILMSAQKHASASEQSGIFSYSTQLFDPKMFQLSLFKQNSYELFQNLEENIHIIKKLEKIPDLGLHLKQTSINYDIKQN